MTPRVEFGKVEPTALQAIMALENYVRHSDIDRPTLEWNAYLL
ncbi:MAG: hypothetical protein AB4290_05295 [Spirulina sp.]